jgi:hypothetical protein
MVTFIINVRANQAASVINSWEAQRGGDGIKVREE